MPGVRDVGTLSANNDGGGSALTPANPADSTRYVALADVEPLTGTTVGERFGRQVANAGDVDGDGAADLAVGADMAYRCAGRRADRRAAAGPGTGGPADRPGTDGLADPAAPAMPTPTGSPTVKRPLPTVTDRSLTANRRGRLTLTVRCAATTAACPGRLTLTLAGARRTAAFSVPAGRTAPVRVTLTAAQRRSLVRRKRLKAKLTLTVAAAGVSATASSPSPSAGPHDEAPSPRLAEPRAPSPRAPCRCTSPRAP